MGLLSSLSFLLLLANSATGFVFSCQEIKDELINSDLSEPSEYVCLVPEEGYTNVEALKTIYAQIDKISVPLDEILTTDGLCVPRVTESGAWKIVADPPISLDCSQQLALIFTSSLPDFIRAERESRPYLIDHERVLVSPRAGMKIHSSSCTGNGNINFFTGAGTGVAEYRYLLQSWKCSEVPDWIVSFENVVTITVDAGVKYSFEITTDYQSETALHPRERVSILTSGKSDNLQNAHPNENYAKFTVDDIVTATVNGQLFFDGQSNGHIQFYYTTSNGVSIKSFAFNGTLNYSFNSSAFKFVYQTDLPQIVWDNQDNFVVDISLSDVLPVAQPTTIQPPTTPKPKPVGPGEVDPNGYCGCGMDFDMYETDGTWDLTDIWIDLIFILDISEGMRSAITDATTLIDQIVVLLETNPSAPFYTRVGVITMADVPTVIYDLNMTNSDDLDVVTVADGVFHFDMTTAFKAALDMFKTGSIANRGDRQHARQAIYYISNSDPEEIDAGVKQFKTSDGIVIVSDFTEQGQGERPNLKELASEGYYSTELKDYINTYPLLCQVNCFCDKSDPYDGADGNPIVKAKGGCYHVNQAGVMFSMSQKDCSKTQNGKISTPHNKDKEFFLNSLITENIGPKKPFWIGYSSNGSQWSFEDQSSNPWTDFAPGENINNGAQCAYQVQSSGFESVWHANNCKPGYPSVCEMAPCSVGYAKCNL